MKRNRLPFLAFTTLSLLTIPFDSSPSDPARPTLVPLPERPVLFPGRATAWLRSGRFRALSPRDLDAALTSSARHFELFPKAQEEDLRRAYLKDLPYGSAMVAAAERNRVDGLLLAAIVEAESRFSPRAVSPRGAVGLMQVLPSTATAFGSHDLYDPRVNLEVGSRYLGTLIEHFDGNLELAIAAYNAGPAAVIRYGGVPPFRETRSYVRRVLTLYERHSERASARVMERAEGLSPRHAVAAR